MPKLTEQLFEKGKLYLIPNTLGSRNMETIPDYVQKIALQLNVFIVENTKEAKRFLVYLGIKETGRQIEDLTFLELNKHAGEKEFSSYLKATEKGINIGLISDAGCPAVADPGGIIVQWAHEKGIEVIPLVGPSSMLLALMASGMNGQNFAFTGYLPIQQAQRIQKIRSLEHRILSENQTQVFIETPYRNQSLFTDLINTCKSHLRLCIAANLTLPDQCIKTQTIGNWKKAPLPDLHKIPAVFVLGI
ncbi:MAG: SAM-dependent methyltransferase [Sphingobacteriales bacterium]|nr:MAG: SAM-dependent methyltransferase [Sphingobacteriales bacterium]